METGEILRALREDDTGALLSAGPLPPDLAGAILDALPKLSTRARLLATTVLARMAGPERGLTLLRLTEDPDEQVSVLASAELVSMPESDLPPAEKIATFIPVQLRPLVRKNLYLALGRTGSTELLPRLRAFANEDKSREPTQKARVAAARLGGAAERAELVERARSVGPRTAAEVFEDLVYVGDPKLCAAVAGWFDDAGVALDLGTHGQPLLVRVRDLATVLASRLGVLAGEPLPLGPCEPAAIEAARRAVKELAP